MIHDPVWGWHLDSAKINLQHLIILGPQDGIVGRAAHLPPARPTFRGWKAATTAGNLSI